MCFGLLMGIFGLISKLHFWGEGGKAFSHQCRVQEAFTRRKNLYIMTSFVLDVRKRILRSNLF